MEIPFEKLQAETLNKIIKEFIYREGTDYGVVEHHLDTKIKQVKNQLKSKKCLILYDQESESVNIVTRDEYQRFLNSPS